MRDPGDAMRRDMSQAGLHYAGPLVADGELHRFKAEGDHRANSWYILYPDPPSAGSFGCFKRGLHEAWCERNGQLSQAEWNAVRHRWAKADCERQRVESERQAKAARIAAGILARAGPVTAHGYLARKGVGAYGQLHQRGDLLLLPLRDSTGELHSLQMIAPNKKFKGERDKTFLTGSRVQGCYFTLADRLDGPIVVAEGYATAASVYEATGYATVAALHAGNLLAVAQALHVKWPAREIIIAADNDQWTKDNRGVTDATAAALAVGARVTIPQFKDTSTQPTDFNDLHQLEGLPTVKVQIEKAEPPKESAQEAFTRLAKLPPIEYEQARKPEAERLGLRLGALDNEVRKRRGWTGGSDAALQGCAIDLPDVDPWPDPVDGAQALSEAAAVFSRYLALPDGAADVMALFAQGTHCFEAFEHSPRLNLTSPEKGCGKTTARDILALLVPRPLSAENLTAPVLFRVVEKWKPTVLADECDSWLWGNVEVRGMFNAGHRRGGQVLRCEGDNHEVRAFGVFGPAVLCGIGELPGTLHDRSIIIRLVRAKPGEIKVRFDSRRTTQEIELRRKLARWAADNHDRLQACDPELPTSANNRIADNWRPLFAIAEVAGGGWPERVARAFASLSSNDDLNAQGIGIALLADIKDLFGKPGLDRLPSAEIAKALAQLEGHPWAEFGKNAGGITANQLARQLHRFRIAPHTIKVSDGSTCKGYYRADFDEAFERFLPHPPVSNRNPVTNAVNTCDSSVPEPSPEGGGLRFENAQNPQKNAGGDGVTVQTLGKRVQEPKFEQADLL
jgi:putative DNA primase/helicase